MVRNRASNDEDFVKPTRYNIPPTRTAKNPPLKPWPLPKFHPLKIKNDNIYGSSNLPADVDLHDPYQIFKLFWTDELLNMLAEYTNKYMELHLTPEDKERACA